MIPWWLGSLIANFCVAGVEYYNRTSGGKSFTDVLSTTWWLILLMQYGLYRAFAGAPSFMLAWAFFTCFNMVIRLISAHYFVGEPLSTSVWVGTSIMFAGMLTIKFGQ